MIKTIDEIDEIGFATGSERALFKDCHIKIVKLKDSQFIARIKSRDNRFHLQRPMNPLGLNDDDVELLGSIKPNPDKPSLKFSSFDHAIHYLNHYEGYHALKGETYTDEGNDFINQLESSYVMIVTKLDSNLNVQNEYYTPAEENKVAIGIKTENKVHKPFVSIDTPFEEIILTPLDVMGSRKVGLNSYFFENKSLLITVASYLSV